MNQNDVIKHWEGLAKQYGTELYATTMCWTIKALEVYALSKWLKNDQDILDVGCGNGLNIVQLAPQFGRSRFVGIDNSSSMIMNAKKNAELIPNAVFYEGMAQRNGFPNDKFDVVMTDRCLINILDEEEQKDTIRECLRVLKPGGLLLLLENSREGKDNQNIMREAYGLKARADAPYNLFLKNEMLTPEEYDFMFDVIKIEEFGGLHDLMLYNIAPLVRGKEFCYDDDLVKRTVQAVIQYRERTGEYPACNVGQNKLWVLKKAVGTFCTANA